MSDSYAAPKPNETGDSPAARRAARRRSIASALVAVVVLFWAPSTAGAVTQNETASSGSVSATLSYDVDQNTENPLFPQRSNEELTISRGGLPAYTTEICGASIDCVGLAPAGSIDPRGPGSVQVADVEANGEPDVVVKLWGGGAHCCAIFRIFRWDATDSTYSPIEHSWELPPRITDLRHDGKLEFLSADFRFGYAFTSFGGSGFPLQISVLRNGVFKDVTRTYPALIRADARKQFSRYRSNYKQPQGGLGYLAAWVADECLLGNRASALSLLRRENRRGKLRAPNGPVAGQAYITKVARFLRKLGYTSTHASV